MKHQCKYCPNQAEGDKLDLYEEEGWRFYHYAGIEIRHETTCPECSKRMLVWKGNGNYLKSAELVS